MTKVLIVVFSVLYLASSLTACGGGGGGGSASPQASAPPPNQAPTANAGVDQTVDEGTTVNLTGTGADSDGTIVSYSWQQESGTTVTIASADTPNASFSAPLVSNSEVLIFQLTVTDNDGAPGADTISVTVNDVPPPPPPPNQAPTANAGVDQTVDEGTTVNLTGTGADSDGTIVSYSWQQVSGTIVAIADSNAANASFAAPMVTAPQDQVFRLTVTDDDGATGSDFVTVTVNDVLEPNTAPMVTVDQPADGAIFNSNDTIILTGTATDAEDGTLSANIRWSSDQDGNLGTGVTLSTTLSVGTHILTASITDSGGISASASITVTVDPQFEAIFTFPGGRIFGHMPVPQTNGFDYYFTPLILDTSIMGDGVTVESIDVSAFGQNNGDVINFDWEVHIGPVPFGLPESQIIQTLVDPVSGYARIAPTQFRFAIGNQLDTQSYAFSGQHDFVSGTTTANPYFSVLHAAFTSPVNLTDGLYAQVFLWTADNRNSQIDFGEITLTIRGQISGNPAPNQSPTADAGADQTVDEETIVSLSGTGADSDGTIASYSWEQESGTAVAITNANMANASFTAPMVSTSEDLLFRLTVTDDDGATGSDTVTVTVNDVPISPPPPPNQSPTANAGADQTVDEETIVSLSGTGADSDGTIASYSWEQESGTAVAITNANMANASFTAPMVSTSEDLLFRLTVTDDDGATGSDTVTVTVNDVPISPPPVFNLSGTISIPDGTAVDGDVNDPFAPFIPNDDAQTAQILPNPVTLGGYVNTPGTGEEGRSRDAGDISDFYRVNLIAGQNISLFVADPTVGDPDLYLWDSEGLNIIDGSINVGNDESLVVPFSGEFLVQAFAFDEASNYILVIGQTQSASAAGGFRLSDDFVPGEIIMRSSASDSATARQPANKPFMSSLDLRMKAGAPDRAMLLALDEKSDGSSILLSRGGNLAMTDHIAALDNEEQSQKFDTLMAIKALNREPTVEYAHPNYIAKAMAVPNDPGYPLQWHYPLINLPAAWDLTVGDPSVIVAVVDSGVLLNHPDLQGQLVAGYDFISNPQDSADGDGIDPNPDDPGNESAILPSSFHGTHVAGTVAARTNNGIGVAGVAANAKIMPIRVLGVGSGNSYDIIQGLRYAVGLSNNSGQIANPAADVINLSLAGLGPCPIGFQEVFSAARQDGVVVVAAAGNENTDAAFFSPGNCDNVITVSAVGIDRNIAWYSNYGTTIDIAAPGGDTSTDLNGDGYTDGVLSTAGDDSSGSINFNYPFYQGTSMASPHVAGVVALMKSVNPNLTPDQVDQMLVNGALTDNIGDPIFYGNGLINARKAVSAALNAAGTPPADNPMLAVTPGSLNFGATSSVAEITARNTGGGTLQVNFPSSDVNWLDIIQVAATDFELTYAVTVDRSGLADGIYSGTITVDSDVNDVQIPVIMQVSAAVIDPDAGFLYVLLIDHDTDEVADQFAVTASGGEYTYQFLDVPSGNYIIVAGTDSDNDLFICDPGEACGAFLTSNQPQVVSVDQDLTNLNFPVGHVITIPAQSLDVNIAAPSGYRRLVEPVNKQLYR